MTNFIVIEKDSLEKSIVNATTITLTEASIVHTKMHRDDVDEFIRDGNNLLLKLKNGELIVIENFFTVYDDVASDLVFEEDGCVLYWFDGVSDFKGIAGLEVLLPEAGSKLVGLLPWLVGAGVVGGIIAATDNDGGSAPAIPNGTNVIQVKSDGLITGATENIPVGSKVKITITGKDKDGHLISQEIETTVNSDGSYTTQVPNDFVDGDLQVKSEVIDQNGNIVKAEDQLNAGKPDNPATPESEFVGGGLDRVDGHIEVHVDNKGAITGTTTDVPANSDVVLTIKGKDSNGNDVEITRTVQTDGNGNYSYQLTPADGIADGSSVDVKAETHDNNGNLIKDTDALAGKSDTDNDPLTPDQGGLDLVDGAITVEIADNGAITGTTTDVPANSDVVLTIKGKDSNGNDVEITRTVQTDGNGNYSYQLTPADRITDGSSVDVKAETHDNNGNLIKDTDALAGKSDTDNDPLTPDQGGLDLVDGAITVDIATDGKITGTTTDVPANSDVVLTIKGKDANGNNVEITRTVQTDGNGNYSYQLTPADRITDGSSVDVKAETHDNNGNLIKDTDALAGKSDTDNDPLTPDQGGLDLVDGAITVEIADNGAITGTTTDVPANSDVVLTIKGKDSNGNDVEITRTVQTDGNGNYSYQLTPADRITDGSSVDVKAETHDNNGNLINDTDALAGKSDTDNDPLTPDQGGLDLVDGAITVEIADNGAITGTTTDVPANSDVVLTIKGKDSNGNDVEITRTVQTDGNGNYSYQLTPADGMADGSSVDVKAETHDNNGNLINDTDALAGKSDTDNDPLTPDQGGLDLVDGAITVEIADNGAITGTTTDVPANSDVVLTIKGKDSNGNDVEITRTVQTDGNGNYSYQLTPADGIADGSSVDVKAETHDNNGNLINDTDALAGKSDTDNDPLTPDQGGLDLVDGAITVEIADNGAITGTTTDVPANSDVVLTIKGKDSNGNDVEITRTVQTDGNGNYSYQLTPADGIADGSSVDVKAETHDNNGNLINDTDALAGKSDTDNDPLTPDQGGLDLVDGAITVEIADNGAITGTTTDVPANSDVVLTIKGKDSNGNDVEITRTVQTDGNGNYSYQLTPADGMADGSSVDVKAETHDNNGNLINDTDALAGKSDTDNDPLTPDQGGLDLVDGAIMVEINQGGQITGTTTDVPANSDVVLTIKGKDSNGNNVEITRTVQTDGNGNYSYQLTPADRITDGSSVDVKAETHDNNGNLINDTDHLDVNLLELYPATITVDIDDNGSGAITGTTEYVATGTDVVLTIKGKDANGNDVEFTRTVQTDGNGHYSYQLTVSDGLVDGSAVDVSATTTSAKGKPVGPATDELLGQGDNDNDPLTPDDTGLNLVISDITVDIDDYNSTQITGTTADVAPGSTVVLHITSIDENGETIDFYQNVKTQSDGGYSYTLTTKQGNATNVVAETYDRNGKLIDANDALEAVIKADSNGNVTNGDNEVVGTSGNDLLAGDIGGLKTNFEIGHNYNVSVVLDLSTSMNNNLAGGTASANNPSRIDIAKAGLTAFITQMVAHDGKIILQLATFSNTGGTGNSYNMSWEVTEENLDTIVAYINGLKTGTYTNPQNGWHKAENWFTGDTTGMGAGSVKADASYENQTYYVTDGEPSKYAANGNSSNTGTNSAADWANYDKDFATLAAMSKVFAVGVSSAITQSTIERFDNTDVDGNWIPNWSATNHGTASAFTDAKKLIAYLIGGSENFIPADVGNDTVKGGSGDDILFGDSMNTNWLLSDPSWTKYQTDKSYQYKYPEYSGYSTLIAYLTDTTGAAPTQQQIYDFVKANYMKFVEADAADGNIKGGDDTIYGGAGDDIIIAGAGNDKVYGGSGNDIISTGRGDDTIVYEVLQTADATAGNGTDTWVDYETNDKIEFGADFFDGLLADKSNISEYIKVEDDGNGNAVVQVDRDGAAGSTHNFADLLIIENQAGLSLQDLLNHNQIVIA